MPYREPPFAPEWMRVTEAAQRLAVHPKTVRNHIGSGKLPVRTIRLGRTLMRLHRQDFEDYMARQALLSSSA